MKKILTISVAAYQVEAYIEENLKSIVASDLRDLIEVFVVDDGGQDRTYELALQFEKKYPGIVYAVHKENGGYGSVQNYSIAHASGKYFKILDGDDWVDTIGLTKLVSYLQKSNEDVIVTNYMKGMGQDSLKLFDFGKHCKTGKPCDPNDMNIAFIGMWALTFKTSVLRKSGLKLPEHTLYTDKMFATIPFSYAKQMIVMDFHVYCYRTGREGQSVSRESRIKHIDEYLRVTKMLCKHYTKDTRENKSYVFLKTAAAYRVSIRTILLLPATKENFHRLKKYEQQVKVIAPDIYRSGAKMNTRMGIIISFLRVFGYVGYKILGIVPKNKIDF